VLSMMRESQPQPKFKINKRILESMDSRRVAGATSVQLKPKSTIGTDKSRYKDLKNKQDLASIEYTSPKAANRVLKVNSSCGEPIYIPVRPRFNEQASEEILS